MQRDAVGALEGGSLEDATAALARLLAVTEANFERRAQLERALHSRIAIEQAKGIVAERYGLDTEDAFQLIRRAARDHRMKIHDLVAAIRPGVETPRELERARLADTGRSNKLSDGVRSRGSPHADQSRLPGRE